MNPVTQHQTPECYCGGQLVIGEFSQIQITSNLPVGTEENDSAQDKEEEPGHLQEQDMKGLQ
jgi:hypothetical protein